MTGIEITHTKNRFEKNRKFYRDTIVGPSVKIIFTGDLFQGQRILFNFYIVFLIFNPETSAYDESFPADMVESFVKTRRITTRQISCSVNSFAEFVTVL